MHEVLAMAAPSRVTQAAPGQRVLSVSRRGGDHAETEGIAGGEAGDAAFRHQSGGTAVFDQTST